MIFVHLLAYLILGFLLMYWIDSTTNYEFGSNFQAVCFWSNPWLTLLAMVILWPLCFVWWLLFYRR